MTQTEDTTAAELAESRSAAEDTFLADVRELEARAARLVDAASAAATSAASREDLPAPITAERFGTEFARPSSTPRQPDQAPWPGGAGLRAVLNRVVGWVLRDYLAALDARHEALAERSLHLEEDLSGALAALAVSLTEHVERSNEALEALEAASARQLEVVSADRAGQDDLREGLARAAEAVDMISGVVHKLRVLGNAKDAEVAHNALSGPDQKIEVVLDRLARRQEALLANLVGRGAGSD